VFLHVLRTLFLPLNTMAVRARERAARTFLARELQQEDPMAPTGQRYEERRY